MNLTIIAFELNYRFIALFYLMPGVITVFYRIHAPPQIDAPPPPKFLDHIPEVSSPKIYMTTLFNDRFNALLTICLLYLMK